MSSTFQKRLAMAGVVLLVLLLGWQTHVRQSQRESLRASLEPKVERNNQVPPAVVASTSAVARVPAWVKINPIASGTLPTFFDPKATNRLRNTPETAGRLVHNPRAIMLRNAFVDTASSVPLEVPSRLHAADHPGAYVVQVREGLSTDLNPVISSAGGRVISYIPNRSWLVAADDASAAQIALAPEVAAVLPYEPYFKLEPGLIPQALSDSPVLGRLRLILTIPEADQARSELARLGAQELHRERGPFGTLVTVDAPASSLVDLARLPEVHLIETWHPARLANDRAGVILGINSNAINTGPYLGLTGKGVLVNLNDSGVDKTHRDLVGRVAALAGATNSLGNSLLTDPDGHGTHVAASIAGDGSGSTSLKAPPQGSVSNANFQGKAPAANLLILPVDLLSGPLLGDEYLQTRAASATNRSNPAIPLISNNSWGYFDYSYSSHSASYDAAVRDALPDVTGDQPILYVFAAGNEGGGGDNGLGGFEDTIRSPGNAKNVITVGALESARNLTNSVIQDTNGTFLAIGSTLFGTIDTNRSDYITNFPFAALTDTDYEVASFSGRGNVGVGTEGDNGRSKPDVVAPGIFTISARSSAWELTNDIPTNNAVYYYLFKDLTNETGPYYRYDSGTSMATPAVSGLLALMQEFFSRSSNGPSPSPAGYKALLINGSIPTSDAYAPDQTVTLNLGGWGEPYLPRLLQPGPIFSGVTGRLAYVIESDDPALPLPAGETVRNPGLATGETRSYRLSVSSLNTNAVSSLVRLTLVWTDPPGNPAGAAKLVNDLDLVVSNEITGRVYVGNRFDTQSGISTALIATNDFKTNADAVFDRINNVEHIVFDPAGASNFVVSVVAHLVNVNTRRDATNAILQDFALAIASDSDAGTGLSTATIAPLAAEPSLPGTGLPSVQILTNGLALFSQRAGANSPLINDPIGQTNQWRFYIFTNTPGATSAIGDFVLTNGSNVAFITFPVGELSRSRTNEPDIDLYVSLDPALTNLDAGAIAAAFKSTSQGATEMVLFTNAPAQQTIYYIGVKSEDHEATEYGFVGVSTDQSFGNVVNGVPTPFALPLTPSIPDGTPKKPGKGLYLAIGTERKKLRKVVATDTIRHQRFADLLGNLKHANTYAVLNNHGPLGGFTSQTNPGVTTTYEDTKSTKYGATRHTDGPGSLKNFIGKSGVGPWFLSMIDNAAGNTGRIANFKLGLVPNDFSADFVSRCVDPYSDEVEFIEVPTDAVELDVTISNMAPALSLELYIKRDDIPDPANPTNSDKYATIQPPGGTLSLSVHDVPPLVSGGYFILVHNPNGVQVCYKIKGVVKRDLAAKITRVYSSGDTPKALHDQAASFSSIAVADNRPVTDVQVGVRLDHGRESDLAMRLTDPAGTSTVLFENRGGYDSSGVGTTTIYTNGDFSHVALVYDRASQLASLYVNARLVDQKVLPRYNPVTTNDFFFHLDPSGQLGGTNVPLIVDDFGIWATAIPTDLLDDIYFDGLLGFGKDPTDPYLGLQVWWPFDSDGSDIVGTNNVALYGNYQIVSGQIGNAVQFSSSDAFGRAIASPGLDVGSLPGFTLEGWINVSAVPELIAGWGNTNDSLHPALLANYPPPAGAEIGSVSALLEGSPTNPPPGLVVLKSPFGINTVGSKTTNILYAVFGDDVETANQLIKFATPPFYSDTTVTIVSVSEFESDPEGVYTVGSILDGWTVDGQVTQYYTPGEAYNGIGFISLDHLGIERSMDVVTNEVYSVSFAAKLSPFVTNGASQAVVLVGTNEIGRVDLDVFWQTNVFHYFSTNAGQATVYVEPSADGNPTNAGVLIDSLVITDGGTGHYLPEEPLAPHIGVNSIGTWALELVDSRAPFSGTLVDWQLTLTLAPTNPPAITLTNGLSYQTNIAGDGTQYFIVQVPPEATAATNTLISISGGPLRLLFNQDGLPDGTLPNDTILLNNVTGSSNRVLDKVNLPTLQPGRRYYLGVQNVNLTDSNVFQVEVDFAINITPLHDGVPYQATNSDIGLLDYYSFDVAPGVLAAQFSLSNFPSDLNLVLSKGQPLPTRSAYQYASTNAGTNPEIILLDLTDQPVPISPGRWYLGVYATGVAAPAPVPYTIVASQITNATPLADLVPTKGKATGIPQYYSFTVPPNPVLIQFALQQLSAPADLYVRLGDVPIPQLGRFDALSVATDTSDRVIELNSNSVPTAASGGVWYVAVIPQGPNPVTFTLTALYSTANAGYTDLLDSVPTYSTITADRTNDLYRFIAPTNTSGLLFELYGLSGEAHLLAAFGQFPAQSTNPLSNFQSSGSSEDIVLRTNAATPDLVGTYYLEVFTLGGVDVQYTIRASTRKNGLLLSGQDLATTLSDLGSDGLPTSLTVNVVPTELYQLEFTTNLSLTASNMVWTLVPPPVVPTNQFYKFPLPPPTGQPGDPMFFQILHLPQP